MSSKPGLSAQLGVGFGFAFCHQLTLSLGDDATHRPAKAGVWVENRYTLMDATLKRIATWQQRKTAVSTRTHQATM